MNTQTGDITLAEIVNEDFHAAEVFEKYGLDFCCGGKQSIDDACREKGINPDVLLSEIKKSGDQTGREREKFDRWELDFLIDYILQNHHAFLRRAMPSLHAHTQKIAAVHGSNHPEVIRIAALFEKMKGDLEQHMMKEEQIVFPAIKMMLNAKRTGHAPEPLRFGSIQNPIAMMEMEHQVAGNETHQIKDLSGNYTLPADACTTFAMTYQELKEFELDLHQHVYLENNLLFPKAIALENEMK